MERWGANEREHPRTNANDCSDLFAAVRGCLRVFASKWFQLSTAPALPCHMPPEIIEGERVRSIVRAFFDVCDYYGYGLAESVYAGAMECALIERGHQVAREVSISVSYKDRHVAWQRLDMIVDERIIVELKATEALPAYADRQLVNYLRVSSFEVGVLLHFGPKPKFHRRVDTIKSPYVVSRSIRIVNHFATRHSD